MPSKHGLKANAIVVLPATIQLVPVGTSFVAFIAIGLGIGRDNAAFGLLLLRVSALLPLDLSILSIAKVGQKLCPHLLQEGMVFCCPQLQLRLRCKDIRTLR